MHCEQRRKRTCVLTRILRVKRVKILPGEVENKIETNNANMAEVERTSNSNSNLVIQIQIH